VAKGLVPRVADICWLSDLIVQLLLSSLQVLDLHQTSSVTSYLPVMYNYKVVRDIRLPLYSAIEILCWIPCF